MKALIIVDVQKDFLPGGNLAVPNGDEVIAAINKIVEGYPLVAVTQDWHPLGHLSFASSHAGKQPLDTIELNGLQQVLWPDHCVWNTEGSEFAEGLNLGPAVAIFRKGVDPEIDSYSGFFDNGRKRKTGLGDWLKAMDVDTVHVAGLAAEYCVAFTAIDAAALGFDTSVLTEATRSLSESDFEAMKRTLLVKGVKVV